MPGERQPQDPARRAAALFAATFGGQPQLLGRGPGRVNLIGEHTDYNEGFALPFAIDRVACAAARLRPDRQIGLVTEFAPGVVHSQLDRLGQATGTGSGWAGYPLGIVWALGEAGADLTALPGFEVAFASDVPVGAGLSSSAAIETSVSRSTNCGDSAWTAAAWPGWASGPRTWWSVRRPASWIRPPPCRAARTARCCWTAAAWPSNWCRWGCRRPASGWW